MTYVVNAFFFKSSGKNLWYPYHKPVIDFLVLRTKKTSVNVCNLSGKEVYDIVTNDDSNSIVFYKVIHRSVS